MSSLIDYAKEHRNQLLESYDNLIDTLANDGNVDQATALEVINRLNITPDQVEKEVAKRKEIRRLQTITATRHSLLTEQMELTVKHGEEMKKVNEQLNALEAHRNQMVTTYNTKYASIQVKLHAANNAQMKLNNLTAVKEVPTTDLQDQVAIQGQHNMFPVYS